jgi:hypothetical protein
MEKTNDGGPAFPSVCVYTNRENEVCSESIEGMTLRQWYAGQALAPSIYVATKAPQLFGKGNIDAQEEVAELCVSMADALIKELEKGKE